MLGKGNHRYTLDKPIDKDYSDLILTQLFHISFYIMTYFFFVCIDQMSSLIALNPIVVMHQIRFGLLFSFVFGTYSGLMYNIFSLVYGKG